MRKFMNIVLFPIVLIVRQYRKYMSSASHKAAALFKYDCERFVKYAGGFHQDCREAKLAQMIMAYHVLEKGLTMPRRRLDFGHQAVLRLISIINGYVKEYGIDDAQTRHAIGCVKEYYELHESFNFNMGADLEYWSVIKEFCGKFQEVPSAKQLELTKEEFFADKDAAFPVFAKSRHTLRHYNGSVDIEKIKKAVELAITAPSACNRQFIKVHCVSNHTIRDELFKLQNGNRGFGGDADKVLVITADLNGNRWPEERNDLYTNAGIFAMNLCYALHYNKIAHCILNWSVSPEKDAKGHKLLGIPQNETIALIISCGNAPDRFMVANSPRKILSDIFAEIK